MKRDKDWIDVMRSTLRDAELPPPAGGWERLQRELGGAAPEPAVPAASTPRGAVWRIWPRIAAAAVLICVVAGEFLLRSDKALENDGTVIASAAKGDASAADKPQPAEPESLQEKLAEVAGLPVERTARTSSSIRRQALLAAAQTSSGLTPETGDRDVAGSSGESATGTATARRAADGTDGWVAETAPSDKAAEENSGKAADGPSAAEPGTSRSGESSQKSSRPAAQNARNATAQTAFGTTLNDEPFKVYIRPRKRTSFSLFAGGGMTGGGDGVSLGPQRMYSSVTNDVSSVVGKGDQIAPVRREGYEESSFRHHQALSFGIAVRKEFAHGLSLESGVNYTLLRSDVRMQYSSDDVSQKLHFIGVPLRMNWQFLERGRFSLYAGAGGMVEKCVSARFGSRSVEENGVQWSALAAVGAQYRLGDMVGLYFEPEGSYYFTRTGLRTTRTDSPLTLTLRLGVRLSF